MRARTRLMLDAVMGAVLVVAFNPSWTGIPTHQWLSIAVVGPLVVHLVVNWEWAMRMLSRFFRKLFSVSRLNFVVDSALLISSVTVVLSGFMVSPALLAPMGLCYAAAAPWVVVHSFSADATMILLAVHGVLHWKWAWGVARRFVQERVSRDSHEGVPASDEARARLGLARVTAAAPRRSGRRAGRGRAQQAAAERALLVRTLSAIGLSALIGVAVFASVGVAQPRGVSARGPARVAAPAKACPVTGCTSFSCHGAAGVRADVFYGKGVVASWQARTSTKTAGLGAQEKSRRATASRRPVAASSLGGSSAAHRTAAARKAAAVLDAASRRTAAARRAAAARKVAAARKLAAVRKVAKGPARRTCPVTGCSASTCHGAHGVSARVWYATH